MSTTNDTFSSFGVPATPTTADDSSTTSRANALPVISQPNSGGAISPIGERFTTEVATGSGSLTIPIVAATTEGRASFSPPITLSYDSGRGNGIFGMGWTVSLGAVTRKTDQGVPRYQDHSKVLEDMDTFVLGDDLVLELELSPDGSWTVIPPQSRSIDGVDYLVRRYRHRLESAPTRLEQWTAKLGLHSFWRTISGDNVQTWYGRTERSRISDPSDPSKVFAWLLCESQDGKGHRFEVEYKREDSVGVDIVQSHERNRTPKARSANLYPKRIRYGNRQSTLVLPNADEYHFELVFDYGEHDTTSPSPNDSSQWPVRHDPFSTYRPGFEIRTYRLCQRLLMFHHFPEELGIGNDCLVRSTSITYGDVRGVADLQNRGHETGSCIISVSASSFRRLGTTYESASLPPVEFGYSHSRVNDRIHDADTESIKNLPYGIDNANYQFVDLDGEGVAGVLAGQQDGKAWLYKEPLGNGKFGPIKYLPTKPSIGPVQPILLDLEGGGCLDMVRLDGVEAGASTRRWEDNHGIWFPFKKFSSIPNINMSDPNLRFLDLTGDGRPDILITENDALTWYRSLGSDGFAAAEQRYNQLDDEAGPRLLFSDPVNTIFLADMSGDGLVDLVRIRNGQVCYWPSQGHCRFGPKVTMDDAPWFDHPDQWDPSRIRLGDIDGNGLTDVVYLGAGGVSLYFNEAGNRLRFDQKLVALPVTDNWTSVELVDFLGNGTICLTWSSSTVSDGRCLRYVDLMGGIKPYLLNSITNNLGAETKIHYAPSTKFYMADKAAGKPWITHVPFPLQVIEKVESIDRIGRTYHSCRYIYHHGHFDGIEREFRGFGMVEQHDTELFDVLSPAIDAVNLDPGTHVPPVNTKTWFQTGLWPGDGSLSTYFEKEYWREPGDLSNDQHQQMRLPDTTIPESVSMVDGSSRPHLLSPREAREACRALKGTVLRQEIFSLDDSSKASIPHYTTEHNYTLELLQPCAGQHAVFSARSREMVTSNYERFTLEVGGHIVCSPRTSHEIALEYDRFGNMLKSVSINYGRRHPGLLGLTPSDDAQQTATVCTYQTLSYTDSISTPDQFYLPLPCESQSYELRQVDPQNQDPDTTQIFSFDDISEKVSLSADGNHDLPFEDFEGSGMLEDHPNRRLIDHSRIIYQKNDLSGPLALGHIESRGLLYQTYQLAYTATLLEESLVDSGKVATTVELDRLLIDQGRYVHSESDLNWWIPSGRTFYSPNASDTPSQELEYASNNFFLPHRFQDPFHSPTLNTEATVRYDKYNLLVLETADACGNRTTAGQRDSDPSQPLVQIGLDYRLLTKTMVMDPNDNILAYAYDLLGMIVGISQMGKPSQGIGDSLAGFVLDLGPTEAAQYWADPVTRAADILEKASARAVYDVWAYYNTKNDPEPSPAVSSMILRTKHSSDLAEGEETKTQQSLFYSDGRGRVIQVKRQTEAGPVPVHHPETGEVVISDRGVPEMSQVDISRRWIGTSWTVYNNKGLPIRTYEPFFTERASFEFNVRIGVSPTVFYDPLGRTVGVLNPNHTWSKIVIHPWQRATWDLNDTCLIEDPQNDPDLGGHFRRLAVNDYLPTWHALRESGSEGADQKQCAEQTSVHAATPLVSYQDSLGRDFLARAQNRTQHTNGTPVEESYETRVVLDIQGNRRRLVDTKGRLYATYTFGMLGQLIHETTIETGQKWCIFDVAGKPMQSWNSRGYRFRSEYDQLQRMTHAYEMRNGNEVLLELKVYGETLPNPELGNTRLRAVKLCDQAGVSTNEAFDFKGNCLNPSRTLARNYKNTLDWSQQILLESRSYRTVNEYDALDQVTKITLPGSTVLTPTYTIDNNLKSIQGSIHGGAPETFVTDIQYDAHGRKTAIEYGNAVVTKYSRDPLTSRLTHILTKRSAPRFPDDCPQPPRPGWAGCQIQSLHYVDDPVGNHTHIRDDSQQAIFFRNKRVEADRHHLFDAVYRLVDSSGREQTGQNSGAKPFTPDDKLTTNIPHPGDGNALSRYLEQYKYDSAGNILSVRHIGTDPAHPGWTREYHYDERSQINPSDDSNRLSATSIGGAREIYEYDSDAGISGNITSFPHLSSVSWDSRDQLRSSSKQTVTNGGTPETTYYVYDGGGQRIRKVTERQSAPGVPPTRKSQTLYLGGLEIYTEHAVDDSTTLERESVHVSDGSNRVAIVETEGTGPPLVRYQLHQHERSVAIELDDAGNVISYEEYTPFGSTSYQAVRRQLGGGGATKRYRHAGKERDADETGFYYYGARHYMPWLGRWTSADPAGQVDGPNVFSFVGNNPVTRRDPDGRSGDAGGNAKEDIQIPLPLTGDEDEAQMRALLNAKHWDYAGTATKDAADPRSWHASGQVFRINADGTRVGDASSGGGSGGDAAEEIVVVGKAPDGGGGGGGGGGSSAGGTGGDGGGGGKGGVGGMGAAVEEEERGFLSRGGGTLLAAGLSIALGAALLLSGPLGWFAFGSAALAITAGTIGAGMSGFHLYKSYTGQMTAAEDEQMNDDTVTVMSFVGSYGGLVGGAVGYLATGTKQGLAVGATIGGIAEGVGGLAKGGYRAWSLVRQWNKLGPPPATLAQATARFRQISNIPQGVRRASDAFKGGVEYMEMSHWISRGTHKMKAYMRFIDGPLNNKMMWGLEHALADSARFRFVLKAMKPTYESLRKTGLQKFYVLAPEWVHEVVYGTGQITRTGVVEAAD